MTSEEAPRAGYVARQSGAESVPEARHWDGGQGRPERRPEGSPGRT